MEKKFFPTFDVALVFITLSLIRTRVILAKVKLNTNNKSVCGFSTILFFNWTKNCRKKCKNTEKNIYYVDRIICVMRYWNILSVFIFTQETIKLQINIYSLFFNQKIYFFCCCRCCFRVNTKKIYNKSQLKCEYGWL